MRALPAAPDGHHDYAGGLLEHTVGVATICRELCQLHPAPSRRPAPRRRAPARRRPHGRARARAGVPADLRGPPARPRAPRGAADRGARRRARRSRPRRAPARGHLPPRRPRREDGRGGRPVPREPAGRGRRDAAGREPSPALAAILLALAASASWGVSDFLGGLTSRRLSLPTVMAITTPLGLVVIGAIVAVRGDADAVDVIRPLGRRLPACSGRSASRSLYQGLAIGQMGVVAPISRDRAADPDRRRPRPRRAAEQRCRRSGSRWRSSAWS